MMYDSPNMSGFTVRLAGSTSWAGTEGSGINVAGNDPGKGSATNLALNYANGPIKAGYSYWRAKAEGGIAAAVAATNVPPAAPTAAVAATFDQRGDTLQFGYAFPMGLNVGIGWNKSKTTGVAGDASRTAWILPVSYAFGANQVNFTYAKAGNTSGVADSGANAYTLTYAYSMSKRTNVGVGYTKLDNKTNGSYELFGIAANGGTATPAGADVSQVSLNVVHSF